MNPNKHIARRCETCRWYVHDGKTAACGNFHSRWGAVLTARDFTCEKWEDWTHAGAH